MSGLLERIARRRRAASKDRPDPLSAGTRGPSPVGEDAPAGTAPKPPPEPPAPEPPAPEPPTPDPEPPWPEPAEHQVHGAAAAEHQVHGAAAAEPPAAEPAALEPPAKAADFRERGALRRRARYLRRLRELQLRDLGGLVVELRRFGRERPDLVEAKVAVASDTARELRALELALRDGRSIRELREPGIGGACFQCGAVHGSSDRFCASCGVQLGIATDSPGEQQDLARAEHGPGAGGAGPIARNPDHAP